jgi:hypothetical protein
MSSRSSGSRSNSSSRSRSSGKRRGNAGAAKSRRRKTPVSEEESFRKLRQTWLNRYFKEPVDSFNQYGDALLSHHKINGKFVESHARVLNIEELTPECINKKYIFETWDLRGKNASRVFGRVFSNYVILKKMTFAQSPRGTEAYLYFAMDTPSNLGRELDNIPAGEKIMRGFVFPISPLGYGTMLYNV